MDISDSQFLIDLRGRVLANKEANRPAKEGISDEEQRRFLALLRPARTLAATTTGKASARKTKQPIAPMSDADVDDLFGK